MPGNIFLGLINNEEFSGKDRKKELEEVNLIKEKRCENIKGRKLENGIQQKSYLKEDESVYSLTCLTE